MQTAFLAHYTQGMDAFDAICDICLPFGHKVALVYGEKAFQASGDKLRKALKNAKIEIVESCCYGKDATYENVEKLMANAGLNKADYLFAIGGGKCIDTIKCVGDKLNKIVFTFPTIASTCAAISKISVMYSPDGTFKEVYKLAKPPVHTFIDTSIIANAPLKYLWAGIGDTLAKYVEVAFSSKNDELDYQSALGKAISPMCFYPMIKYGEMAYQAAQTGTVNTALEQVIQNIIISCGNTSILVDPNYNSALAHALFYGFTCRKNIETNHLHGEVVSYGVLVQLMLDKQFEDLKLVYPLYKAIKLPTKLSDLEISADDDLEDVLALTLINKELDHIPYPITKAMIIKAINDLENFEG